MPRPSFAVIIPARYQSSRFPGKPLALLRGASGEAKTLIRRTHDCALAVEGAAGVWVATDDERIADEVRGFGGAVVMTSPDCRNGTERCADAIDQLGDVAEVIVNLQGDAPLSPAPVIPALVERLELDRGAAMATPAVRCSASTYAHLAGDAAAGRVGGTTAVFDRNGRALYFSKRILPYIGDPASLPEPLPVFLHLGVYAYRPEALRRYRAAGPTVIEELEGLEQLRFLDMGLGVAVEPLEALAWDSIELNNPSDVPVIERLLRDRAIA